MIMRKFAVSTAALCLAAVPVVAQAADAERTSQPAAKTSELAGTNTLFLLAALAAIAVGILLIADEDDEEPTSA